MAAPTQTARPTATTGMASRLLREAALQRPDDVFLQVDELCVSCAEFDDQVGRLAQRLFDEIGVPGECVAVRVNGTHALAVAFLAIERAGMVSVPIDPTAPADRVQSILADIDAAILLGDLDDDLGASLDLRDTPSLLAPISSRCASDVPRGEIASIVYTSGSTGTPKGIMIGNGQIEHMYAQFARAGCARERASGCDRGGDRRPHRAHHGYRPCAEGHGFVAYEIRRHGIAHLAEWLEREEITAIGVVPTIVRHLLSTLNEGQQFPGSGGCRFTARPSTWEDVIALRRHLPPDAIIVNVFGLSEAGSIASVEITSDITDGHRPAPGRQDRSLGKGHDLR